MCVKTESKVDWERNYISNEQIRNRSTKCEMMQINSRKREAGLTRNDWHLLHIWRRLVHHPGGQTRRHLSHKWGHHAHWRGSWYLWLLSCSCCRSSCLGCSLTTFLCEWSRSCEKEDYLLVRVCSYRLNRRKH